MSQKLTILLGEMHYPDSPALLGDSANSIHPLSIDCTTNLEHCYLQLVGGKDYNSLDIPFSQLFNQAQKIITHTAFQEALHHTQQHQSNLHLIFVIGSPHLSVQQIVEFLALLPSTQTTYLHLILEGKATYPQYDSSHQDAINEPIIPKDPCYLALKLLEQGLVSLPHIQIASLGGKTSSIPDKDLGFQGIHKLYESIVCRQEQISYPPHEYLYQHLINAKAAETLSPVSLVMGEALNHQDALILFNPSASIMRDFFLCFAPEQFAGEDVIETLFSHPLSELFLLSAQQLWEGTTIPFLIPRDDHPFLSQLLAQQDLRQTYVFPEGDQLFSSALINPQSKDLFDGQKNIIIPQAEMRNSERKLLTENQKIYALTHALQSQSEFFFYKINRSEESAQLLDLLKERNKEAEQDVLFIAFQVDDPSASMLYYFGEKELKIQNGANIRIEDLAPSILNYFSLPIPEGMSGKSIF